MNLTCHEVSHIVHGSHGSGAVYNLAMIEIILNTTPINRRSVPIASTGFLLSLSQCLLRSCAIQSPTRPQSNAHPPQCHKVLYIVKRSHGSGAVYNLAMFEIILNTTPISRRSVPIASTRFLLSLRQCLLRSCGIQSPTRPRSTAHVTKCRI